MGQGKHRGTVVTDAGIAFGTATGTREQAGRSYERARWTAPWQMSDFAYTELIASWAATTPGDSWLEVEVRGRNSKGVTSSWDLLGRWTSGDKFVRRTTESPQSDDLAAVDVDTWKVRGGGGLVSLAGPPLALPQARLHRPDRGRPRRDDEPSPRVSSVDVSTPGRRSAPSSTFRRTRRWRTRATTRSGVAAARRGARRRRPRWCSATSTRCRRRTPTASCPRGIRRPGSTTPPARPTTRRTKARQLAVQHRVRRPARRRRLRHPAPVPARGGDVRRRGHPLVASVSWGAGELSGAPVSSSNGHLVVIVGFTASGRPVVNDPAAKTAAGVRHVYDRGSSRTPGCRSPAAWSTSSTTPPTRCRPRRPRPTGSSGDAATSPFWSLGRPLRDVLRPSMRKARGNLSPLSTYNAPGALRQDPPRGRQSRSCPPAATGADGVTH